MRFRFGEFVLDSDRHQLFCGSEPVHLKPKAYQLLEYLVVQRPKVVSQQELDDHLWPDSHVAPGSIHALIHEIREALADQNHELIRTAYGSGFSFSAEISGSKAPSHWQVVIGDREFDLMEGENLVGRDWDARVRIDSPSVSRRHARILVRAERVTIVDLKSKNGTHVRGKRIHSSTEVADGDDILFGSIRAAVRNIAASPSTETVR
jgi:DNA-binding winged helix-turn-helix (wHTH) protein